MAQKIAVVIDERFRMNHQHLQPELADESMLIRQQVVTLADELLEREPLEESHRDDLRVDGSLSRLSGLTQVSF